MNVSIIGGNIDKDNQLCKSSGIVNKINNELCNVIGKDEYNLVEISNGINLSLLKTNVSGDLIIWMPNINNEEDKHYPTKPIGSVLICSKVMREGYKRIDSVSRIFKMHGNAVIEIYKDDPKNVRFCLVDALANEWVNTSDINELCIYINKFYEFTKSANRVRTKKGETLHNDEVNYLHDINNAELLALLDINRKLQDSIMNKCGNRFFGNISTRCQKLFPSKRIDNCYMFVSPRNSNKNSLEPDDMVLYDTDFNEYYSIDKKPSVDSPCQAILYNTYKNINYMIHGHATIIMDDVLNTNNYKLCGDINEAKEIMDIADINGTSYMINLKNHGFLLMADTLDTLNSMVDNIHKNAKMIIK